VTLNSTDHSWRRRALKWVPIALAGLVLFFLFRTYPPSEIAQEVTQGTCTWLFPIAFLAAVIGLLLVTLADRWVFGKSLGPISYGRTLSGKAGSSVLDIVGYAASHGGYALWAARATKTQTGEGVGAMLYIMVSDLAAVCFVAALPILLTTVNVSPLIVFTTPAIALAAIFILVMPRHWRGEGSPRKWRRPFWLVDRRSGLCQLGLRIGQILVWVGATHWAAASFGLSIPLATMCAVAPLILLATALPMNVAGFGIAQGTWLLLLDWAPAAQLLAFGLLWNFALAVAVVLRGLPFIKPTLSDLTPTDDDLGTDHAFIAHQKDVPIGTLRKQGY